MGISKYTPEIGDEIERRLADGESLNAICGTGGIPSRGTVHRWIQDDVGNIRDKYARGKEIGLRIMADEIMAIADEPVGSTDKGGFDPAEVNKQRLRIDARKWILSKLVPKTYGDRTTTELTGADGGPVQFSDAEREAKVKAILAKATRNKTEAEDQDASDLV